jgi:hypothetical protein
MSDSTPRLTLQIRFAWWLPLYNWSLVFVAVLMQRDPDMRKVGKVLERAIRVRKARP